MDGRALTGDDRGLRRTSSGRRSHFLHHRLHRLHVLIPTRVLHLPSEALVVGL